jgi:hypothetical protein
MSRTTANFLDAEEFQPHKNCTSFTKELFFMHAKPHILITILTLATLFSGCTGLWPKPAIDLSHRPEECSRFFQQIAETVNETQVPDAGSISIPNFPYLRTSRFLSALGKTITDDEGFTEWLGLLKQQAISGLEKEIRNLPKSAVEELASALAIPPDHGAFLQKIRVCASTLAAQDETEPDFRNALLSAAHAPDEYSRTMRILGLYPLASLPVAYLTQKARTKFRGWFETPMENLPVQGRLIAFGPEPTDMSAIENFRNLFATAPVNALHMKVFDLDSVRKLAEALAPTIVQDVSGRFDVPGKVQWENGRICIDTSRPALYYYLSYAIIKEQPIVQINYVAWFSGREGPLAPWIERGPLDGLTLRISLSADGDPFMLDIMNSCGCYHLFIPRKGAVVEKKQPALAMDAFLPQWLPDDFPDFPLLIRTNSGWHQVQRAWTSKEPPSSTSTYRLIPYDELETLPHQDGEHESAFNARGIMKGSDRIEPFLLFSMGVPSVGSMRQRGHHAISLVGWDHFDAPDLFEKNFVFK